ncbi:hypothetical protein V8G54_018953 [Vigna mungo]|uniref:Mitochondrial import inner membrane translocase subunit TIM50 n=1 Tax=Vigna mungo TaxID=3915 RepID=A0AAQ3N9M0_VIGMU
MAGKKLLVMNLNGLLMHRVPYRNVQYIRAPNGVYGRSGKFAGTIFSYVNRRNIDGALAIAMGSIRENISFKLDRIHCTDSGYPSLERRNKPLFFKEFNKMWKNVKKSGPFNVSNTLMIDDKPYKAFLNPDNTAIFPESYDVNDVTDRGLDPRGELCSYLEAVANAPDVPFYVKDHPFGQLPITSAHPHWKFYSEVKQSLLDKRAPKIV